MSITLQISQQSMYLTVVSTQECIGPIDGKFLLSEFANDKQFEINGDVRSSRDSSSTAEFSAPSLSLSSLAFQPITIPLHTRTSQ